MSRIKKAAANRWVIMGEDRVLGTENLRPDLVIRNGEDIIIFDVTVPFKNGLEAFDDTRRIKVEEYKSLAEELTEGGKRAVVEAIVVGALGSRDSVNDKSLRIICAKSYLRTMKKIIVSETISFSNDVYQEHIRRVAQLANGRQV